MNPLWKDNLREIRYSLARFLSIFAIITIGVAFFIGIKATGPTMVETARNYYENYNMPDGKVMSDVGLNQQDLQLLEGQENVHWQAVKTVYTTIDPGTQNIKVFGYDEKQEPNFFRIVEGRLPSKANEIALDAKYLDVLNESSDQPLHIGDQVKLKPESRTDDEALEHNENYQDSLLAVEAPVLNQSEFEIVGFIQTPLYFERNNRGEGSVTVFGLVLDSVIESNIYSEAYYWSEEAKGMKAYEPEYEDQLAKLQKQLEARLASRPQERYKATYEDIYTTINEGEEELRDGLNTLNETSLDLSQAREELKEGEEEFDRGLSDFALNQQEFFYSQAEAFELQSSMNMENFDPALAGQMSQNENLAEDANGSIEGSLLEGHRLMREAERDLLAGNLDIQNGLQASAFGQRELNNELPEALGGIHQGNLDLRQAQESLEELEEPIYTVNTRQDLTAYSSLYENADKLNVIANIFPVFFFGIAILVVYTTVKRMASEQRNYMGTLKQMGYSNLQVLYKFLVYAGVAGVLGVVFGLILGYLIFPPIVIGAYNSMFYLENIMVSRSLEWNIIVGLIALACAIIPAIYTPLKMLQQPPAQLLQPEPPKKGKNILIEKIGFIWNRLDFRRKMTIRNLFRYKGRNSMTLIGVAGCAMLIVTGYGISDTVSGVVGYQFEDIQPFDAIVYLEDNQSEFERQEALEALRADPAIEGLVPVHTHLVEIDSSTVAGEAVSLVVPLVEEAEFSEFVDIRRRNQPDVPINLSETGPVITERLAELIDSEVGGELTFRQDSQDYQLTIGGVVENYVLHYIYLAPETFTEIMQEAPLANTFYVKYQPDILVSESEDRISNIDSILTVVNLSTIEIIASQATDSLNIITIVLIISAAGLAFVVLYNLTNINIEERIRELSTIKVLGFYSHEVTLYIYEEIIIITIIGSILGLILGRILTHVLMKLMQMNNMLFAPEISWASYTISFVLTFLFSSSVMLIMHRKIKNINMVEALKAVE